MKTFYKDQRLADVHSEFIHGRRKLMNSPSYEGFRVLLIRKPAEARKMLADSPECVLFAACLMSNAEMDYELCHDAADKLLRAVKEGVGVGHALHVLAGVMMTDEYPSIRAKAADIIAAYAEKGNDVSKAYPALEAAMHDRSPEVSANARRALDAANRIS